MTSIFGGSLDPEPVARLVRNGKIVNRILASICGQENMSKIGVKAELQNRIIDKLYNYAASNDRSRFDRLKTMIENPSIIPPNGQYSHVKTTIMSPASAKSSASMATIQSSLLPSHMYGDSFGNTMRGIDYPFRPHGHQAIQLKSSPYYVILEQLGPTVLCDVMATHRYTTKISLSVNQYPILSRISLESDIRVMVFGSPGGPVPQYIAFPHQSELKVNGGEIKANLRGLKNKPGSTRPVDITDDIRFNPPNYINNIEMTYALTNKKFYFLVAVIRSIPVPNLVKSLTEGQKITQHSVLTEMLNKSRDTDIITTSSVLSLKCPLSTLRIDLPCRSTTCRHNQCFDATSYLQLQEQGPTWSCPICNNPAPFESLAVDEYVFNILKKTSRSVDQVTIQPDGKWDLHDKKENSLPNFSSAPSDSDDEIIVITKSGSPVPNSFGLQNPGSVSRPLHPLCNGPSKEATSSSMGPASNKRSIAAIIDLTSSADEDEEPLSVRNRKRQFTGSKYDAPPMAPSHRPISYTEELRKY